MSESRPDFHPPDCKQCQSGGSESPYDWSFIPLAVCISLKERDDRTSQATEQFHRVGLCSRVLFYRPERDRSAVPRPSTRGCWESHRKIATMARDTWKLDRVLVFEDDVLFDDNVTPERVAQFGKAMASLPGNWNGFFLGHWPLAARPTATPNVLRAWSLSAHAYVMHQPLMDWFIAHPFDSTALSKSGGLGHDCYFALKPRMYAFYPMLAYQSGSPSSNPKPKISSRIQDLALSDPKYMKASQYAGIATYFVILLAVVALIVAIVCRLKKKSA